MAHKQHATSQAQIQKRAHVEKGYTSHAPPFAHQLLRIGQIGVRVAIIEGRGGHPVLDTAGGGAQLLSVRCSHSHQQQGELLDVKEWQPDTW
jgi:hypothetical protein